ncbi:MAG: right-handed parallel beta-helix repeat-containing protein, partial [Planctomycetota bacterium]
MRCTIFSVSIMLILLVSSHADTIHVPADQPTIQAGIDAAVDGDTVLVAPGTYVENIDFIGKAITVKSSEGAQVTTIDGGNPANPEFGSVVTFAFGEGADSVIEGFTLTNGIGYKDSTIRRGGGIACYNASPTILDNHIKENAADLGSGIYVYWSTMPLITHCVIENNRGSKFTAAVECHSSGMVVEHSIIQRNPEEGGIQIGAGSTVRILGNIVAENGGTGINCNDVQDLLIKDNIIRYNEAQNGAGIKIFSSGAGLVKGNVIKGNWAHSTGAGTGGGLRIGASNVVVEGNLIAYNTADTYGGGVFHWAGTLINNTICYNEALNGGGLYTAADSDEHIYNCMLYGNHATEGGGGLYIAGDYDPVIGNFTLAENTAAIGNGIFV